MELVKKCLTVMKNNKIKTLLIVFVINMISLIPHFRIHAKNKDKKIAIVGAGPSGILTAYFLEKQGYKNITLYGDPEKNQTTTINVDGVICDVGACYVTNNYHNSVSLLLDEFNIKKIYLDEANYLDSLNYKKIRELPKEYVAKFLTLFFIIFHVILYKFIPKFGFIYSISMERYLDRVFLSKLSASFMFSAGSSSQGYGYLSDVHAYRLMKWLRPSLFLTGILTSFKKGTASIDCGYGNLFNTIYNSLSCIKTREYSTTIQKNTVCLANKNKSYEAIFNCVPLKNIDTPLEINDNDMEFTRVGSFLWTSNKPPNFKRGCYIKDLIEQNTFDKIICFHYWGKTNQGLHVYWGFVYVSKNMEKVKLKPILQEQANELGYPVENIEYFEIVEYNHRLTKKAIKINKHRYIESQQGKNGIWYLGGMVSHWDIDNIYEHSKEITTKFCMQENKSIINKIKGLQRLRRLFWIETW